MSPSASPSRTVRPRPAKGSRAPAPPRRRFSARGLWLPLLVAAITVAAFWPAIRNGFTDWDDNFYVTEQPLVRHLSPGSIGEIFSHFVDGNYHPLTIASLAVDYRLGQLDPRVYHVTNIAVHVLAAMAVYAFIFVLSGSTAMAAITALFFGIHPLHVESVAWVSGRKDMLYTLFYLGGCISYVFWRRRRKRKYYAGTLVLFVLSLLSKGMAVSFPLALLAIDFYLEPKKKLKALLLEKAPFFLIAAVFGYIAVVAQAKQGAVQELSTYSFFERILFACYGISAYLVRAVAPVRLSALYPYPLHLPGGGLPLVYYLAPLGAIGFLGLCWLSLKRGRGVAFGALFFLVNVALVLQLFPVGSAVIADRYTYLSFVGIGFILATLVVHLFGDVFVRRRALQGALIAILAAAGVGAFLATRARCEVWHDNLTLWNDVLARYPNLPMGYTMRARTYMQRNQNNLALADAQSALYLDPKQPRALTIRGTIRYLNHDVKGALQDLKQATVLEPNEAVQWNGLGAVHLAMHLYDLGIDDFTKAIERKPDYAEAYLNRALALSARHQFQRALPDFDAAVRMQPENARAYLYRGEARLLLKDRQGAVEDYSRSIDIDPGTGEAHYARARANEWLGRFADAYRDGLRAKELGYPISQNELDRYQAEAKVGHPTLPPPPEVPARPAPK